MYAKVLDLQTVCFFVRRHIGKVGGSIIRKKSQKCLCPTDKLGS